MTPAGTAESRRTYGILVVDDENCVRDVLKKVLLGRGFRVWLASSGYEGLDVYHRFRARIDVVLLDVCMPELDGPQTLAALRQVAPHVRCCFMSGYLGSHTDRGLRDLGAAAVFEKPFGVLELSEAFWELAASERCRAGDDPTASFKGGRLDGDPSGEVDFAGRRECPGRSRGQSGGRGLQRVAPSS